MLQTAVVLAGHGGPDQQLVTDALSDFFAFHRDAEGWLVRSDPALPTLRFVLAADDTGLGDGVQTAVEWAWLARIPLDIPHDGTATGNAAQLVQESPGWRVPIGGPPACLHAVLEEPGEIVDCDDAMLIVFPEPDGTLDDRALALADKAIRYNRLVLDASLGLIPWTPPTEAELPLREPVLATLEGMQDAAPELPDPMPSDEELAAAWKRVTASPKSAMQLANEVEDEHNPYHPVQLDGAAMEEYCCSTISPEDDVPWTVPPEESSSGLVETHTRREDGLIEVHTAYPPLPEVERPEPQELLREKLMDFEVLAAAHGVDVSKELKPVWRAINEPPATVKVPRGHRVKHEVWDDATGSWKAKGRGRPKKDAKMRAVIW